jgi:hypothetical protein
MDERFQQAGQDAACLLYSAEFHSAVIHFHTKAIETNIQPGVLK